MSKELVLQALHEVYFCQKSEDLILHHFDGGSQCVLEKSPFISNNMKRMRKYNKIFENGYVLPV